MRKLGPARTRRPMELVSVETIDCPGSQGNATIIVKQTQKNGLRPGKPSETLMAE